MNAITPVILHEDFFSTTGFGGGINHRADQVNELLSELNLQVVRVEFNANTVSKIRGLILGFRHLWIRGFRSPWRCWQLGRQGRRLGALIDFFNKQPPNSCVVWCLSNNFIVPYAARICGLKILAAPTTFESLVPWKHEQFGGGSLWDKLKFEVSHLVDCNRIFCISMEEQLLLAGFGAVADYLPTYPASKLHEHLRRIRELRSRTEPKHTLVLSSSNPANLSGIRRLAEILSEIPDAMRFPIRLVGNQMDQYRNEAWASMFEIAGTVSQDKLDDLMASARAMLIYQNFGTGALTRIPEALVAGIPVICNGIAARSARHYQGVHTFESSSELKNLLLADLPTPEIPPRPRNAELRFINAVRNELGAIG